jgi:hypothetical protein
MWLDQEDVGFVFCDWAMFHTLRDHEHFARTKPHGAVSKLNDYAPAQDKKKIVSIVVLVPNKLALYFDHHQVMPVELTDHAGLPVF